MNKQRLIPLLLLLCRAVLLYGQQDPMFTNYHFNSLIFNPAYAGGNEHLSANLMHRQQWFGFEGAPVTQSLVLHSPLKTPRVGLGFSLVNDRIGPTGTFDLEAAYAYRMLLGKNKQLKLAIGLQAGVMNWHSDLIDVVVEQGSDPVFQENFSRWLPNFGAGVLLSGQKFYAALGCPRLLEHDLRQPDGDAATLFGQTYRHWYLATGAAFPLRQEQLVFRPSILWRNAGLGSRLRTGNSVQRIGAPGSLNLDAAFLIRQTYWIGITYRTAVQASRSSNDSIDCWAAWQMRNGLRLGAAYDLTLSRLQNAGGNAFELMLGYEFDIKVKQVASPRYF